MTGWVACDYSMGDRLVDVRHGDVHQTWDAADDEYDQADADGDGYEGIRWVGSDGYLYVEPDNDPQD